MTKETAILSKQQLQKLAEKLILDDDWGHMSLSLGERHPLNPGYPSLSFMRFGNYYSLCATEPVPDDPGGYERTRPLILGEISLFVEVARLKAPESAMTLALVVEATKLLTAQRAELAERIETINQILIEIEG